jgi:protein-disulfide isomerase
MHPTIERLLGDFAGRVRFVHRDFPLAIHERAVPAARAARCAGEQNRYWEFFDRVMVEESGLGDADLLGHAEALELDLGAFSSCIASDRHDAAIQSALLDGQALGVSGTPTFFVNGRLLEGSQSYQALRTVVEEELELAGRQAS